MSELPDKDFYPETLVNVTGWGEWELSSTGKAFRPGVVEGEGGVKVYESGVVLRASSDGERKGPIVSAPPSAVVRTSEAARSLIEQRHKKAREAFTAGLVSGAAAAFGDKVPGEISEYTAWGLVAASVFETAVKGGRDGVTAAKFIGQAADLLPTRAAGQGQQDGGGVHYHFHNADVGKLIEAMRGEGGKIVEGEVRDVGEG